MDRPSSMLLGEVYCGVVKARKHSREFRQIADALELAAAVAFFDSGVEFGACLVVQMQLRQRHKKSVIAGGLHVDIVELGFHEVGLRAFAPAAPGERAGAVAIEVLRYAREYL